MPGAAKVAGVKTMVRLPRVHHPRLFGMTNQNAAVPMPKGFKRGGSLARARAALGYAKGGSVRGYDDGGSIPGFAEYLGSGAAPKGLSPEEYQSDYANYAADVDRAKNPATGMALNFRDPQAAAQRRDENTRKLAKVLGSGAWSLLPWVVPELGMALTGLDVAHDFGMAKSIPGYAEYSDLPSKLGVDTSDPAWRSASALTDMAGFSVIAPHAAREILRSSKSALGAARQRLRGWRPTPPSLP